MDFEFSPDALMLRDMLRKFVEDEVRPLEMKYFSSGGLEDNERARLRTVIEQMGLWGITVPEKHGGGGLDMVTACLLEEELGRTFLPMEIGDVPPIMYACQGEQIEKFLHPALAGTRHPILAVREAHAIRPEEWTTTATSEGGGYILNGSKLLPCMPSAQDFVILLAKASEGISAFILEPDWSGIQYVKNGSLSMQLDGCRIQSGSLLGECGQGIHLGADEVPAACIRLGARHVGLSERLLDMSIAYAKSWVVMGALLKERPAVQRMLAEVKVRIESTRWLVYHAAWRMNQQGAPTSLAAQVRLATAELLSRTTDLTTMVHGGPGPSKQVDMYRYARSTISMDALEFGLEGARLAVAAELLTAGDEG